MSAHFAATSKEEGMFVCGCLCVCVCVCEGSIRVRRKESEGKETRMLTQRKRDKQVLIRWVGEEGQRIEVGGKRRCVCVCVCVCVCR